MRVSIESYVFDILLARIDLKTFQVDFASAGHNQMLLCRNNATFEELNAKGIPLGIMPEFDLILSNSHRYW